MNIRRFKLPQDFAPHAEKLHGMPFEITHALRNKGTFDAGADLLLRGEHGDLGVETIARLTLTADELESLGQRLIKLAAEVRS